MSVLRRLLHESLALTASPLAVSGRTTLDAHVMCPPAHTRFCGSTPSAEHTCCIRHGNVRRDRPEYSDAAVPMQLPA
jgi:hypothetical protein